MNTLAYLVFTGHMEYQILLTVLVVVLCALPTRRRPIEWFFQALDRLARRRRLAILAVFIISFIITAALAVRRGLPLPYVHDEFSYLLAADTFARGRLTNPTPPCWQHFESMHILLRPSYMSKYPPAPALFMALGQACAGHPIWGVWLCTALAAAASCWMLFSFLPRGWALLGGLLMALHPQSLEWGQRYWGGSAAVLGGALLLGSIARIAFRRPSGSPRPLDAAWAAIALLLLANSRPFEGVVLAVLLFIPLAIRLIRRRPPRLPRGLLLRALLVLIPGAIWMGYYNWRITGHSLRLPYVEHHRQYAIVPLFIFQEKSTQPTYNHRELEQFWVREQGYWYARHGNWPKLWEEVQTNIIRLYQGCLGNVSVLAIPLLILPWIIFKDRRMRLLVLVLIVFLAALLTETYMFPHYAAPAAGLVAAIDLIAMRWMYRFSRRLGRLLVRTTLAVFLLWSLFWWLGFFGWGQGPQTWYAWRNWIENDCLAKQPGKHLAIVRYGPHNVHEEWVYNSAEMQSQRVIWAREMDPDHNGRLLDCFRDRTAWLVEPESTRREPIPYVLGAAPNP